MSLYKSDAEGNAQGDAVAGTGAFDNQGALLASIKPGDYVVRAEALLAVAATYEATATLTPAEDGAEYGPEPRGRELVRLVQEGGRRVAAGLHRGGGRHGPARRHPAPGGPGGGREDAGDPLDRPVLQPHGPDRPRGPDAGHSYGPFATPGPSNRFADFVLGADVIRKGYTFVHGRPARLRRQQRLPRLGRPRRAGRREAAVEWAASQPWSTGKVGMYGKSYDGVTGLLGEILQPKGLAAVVSQEPVYDMYRYLYADGIRFLNSLATPGALRRDRGDARQRRGRARLLHRQREQHAAARLRGASTGPTSRTRTTTPSTGARAT